MKFAHGLLETGPGEWKYPEGCAALAAFRRKHPHATMHNEMDFATGWICTNWDDPLSATETAYAAYAAARHTPDSATFFHGGLRGRNVGDRLLPSGQTGSNPRADRLGDIRTAYTFFTAEWIGAAEFADRVDGVVYEVKPEGLILTDPILLRTVRICLHEYFKGEQPRRLHDFPDGMSLADYLAKCATNRLLCAASARVLAVHEGPFEYTPLAELKESMKWRDEMFGVQ